VQKVLQNLLELQSVDSRLNEVRAQLATFPKRLAEIDAHLTSAKAAVEQSKAAQVANFKDRKKYELDVEQTKERVKKYKDQMSQVKTNEAYKALQHEVQMAEGEIAKAEDRLLEQMVSGEIYDQRIKASEKDLKEVEEAMRRERSKMDAEKSVAGQDLAVIEAERAHVVTEIPEDLLIHYDRIAKKHNGVSLAPVRNEKCGACGMIVRPHVFQEMRRSTSGDLIHCETCTRILYLIEPPAAEGGPASAASASPSSNLPNES